MRGRRRNLLIIAGLALIGACDRTEVGTARYSHDQCRRLDLVDAATGDRLVGAEDFALDASSGRLYFSAYDRRSVEKAARRGDEKLPEGGVFEISLKEVFDTKLQVEAVPLVAPGEIAGGLRPHGLSYDADNHELVFINRSYHRSKRGWKMEPHLQRIGANGEMFVAEKSSAPCAANNVLVTNHATYTSFDHSACDWRARFEDLLNLKRTGVVNEKGVRLYERAAFANGLARTKTGGVVLAATRNKELIFLEEEPGGLVETARIETPGSPDNLTISYDGAIVAAVHPSLLRLALNRKLGLGKAPSRIIKTDTDTGDLQTLFNDRSGKLFSAATVAVEMQEGLIAGSVTDAGILVCREAV